MTASESVEIVRFLAGIYGKNLEEEQLKAWMRMLAPYPYQQARDAAQQVASKSKFFPSWAEYRERLLLGDMPDPEVAFGRALANRGLSDGNGLIASAVRAVGGTWAFEHCENVATLRNTFLAAYREALDQFERSEEESLLRLAAAPSEVKVRVGGKS